MRGSRRPAWKKGGSVRKRGHAWKSVDLRGDRRKDGLGGWEEGVIPVYLYFCLYRQLVEHRERVNEKSFSRFKLCCAIWLSVA